MTRRVAYGVVVILTIAAVIAEAGSHLRFSWNGVPVSFRHVVVDGQVFVSLEDVARLAGWQILVLPDAVSIGVGSPVPIVPPAPFGALGTLRAFLDALVRQDPITAADLARAGTIMQTLSPAGRTERPVTFGIGPMTVHGPNLVSVQVSFLMAAQMGALNFERRGVYFLERIGDRWVVTRFVAR